MEEVTNQGVEQAIAQELASPETETAQEVSQQQPQEVDRNDRNWRELREAKEEWKRKAKMSEELLHKVLAQQQIVQPQAQPQPQVEDIIQELAREEYPQGEKVARSLKKIEEKFEKKVQEIEKRYADQQQNSMFSGLRQKYSDFDQVVNAESIAQLEETNPELSAAIASVKDKYAMALLTYEHLKGKITPSSETTSRRIKETEAKIEQNKKAVQTPQVLENRPMAQAFKMGEFAKRKQERADLYNEMNGYAQQVGMGY